MGTKIKHVYLSACIDIITLGDYERLICLYSFHRTGIRMQPHYSACLLGEESKRSARVGELCRLCTALKRLPASPHRGRAARKRTQLFLIGNSAPMVDLHSGACASLNPCPARLSHGGKVEGTREKNKREERPESRGVKE